MSLRLFAEIVLLISCMFFVWVHGYWKLAHIVTTIRKLGPEALDQMFEYHEDKNRYWINFQRMQYLYNLADSQPEKPREGNKH